ncbi:MAG TPA: HAMP domain-containing sensor histidine kinase [Acidimicrobiia bacterium]|nr:HAMP domain-containing sensor histidine kinase [Acidimicrobiia bacterium]
MRPRILGAIVGIALLAVTAMAIPLAIRLGNDERGQSIARLERTAAATASRVPDRIGPGTALTLPDPASDGDLAVYDANGIRRAGEGPALADPVVVRALAGHTNSGTAGASLVVGVPIVRGLRVIAAVRVSEPIAVTDSQVRRQRVTIVLLGAAAIAIAILVGLAVSSALARPLRRLRTAATRLGQGDFGVRAPRSGIAEVDDVARSLDDTAAQLGELVERERTFSAHASHQLRTPLASLRLAVEAELARPRADPSMALEEVLAETDRLEGTINDLLLLARGTAERGPVDPDAVARSAERRWHGGFASVGRPIRVRSQGDAGSIVQASRSALDQILDVLLDNALQHGAGVVTIFVRSAGEGGVVIAVDDEGAGITGNADAVFTTTAQGGHGFGLPLAAALAHAEGARLRLAHAGPHPVFELTLR